MFIEWIGGDGFIGTFVVGCIMFYIATRILSRQEKNPNLQTLLSVIAWTFYAFGLVLTITAIAQLPQCEKTRNEPETEVEEIDPAITMPPQESEQP